MGDQQHTSLFESVSELSSCPPLTEHVRIQAEERFRQIIEHFTAVECKSYNKAKLVGLTHQYAVSSQSKDNVLQAFFRAMNLPMEGDDAIDLSDELHARVVGFAEYLVNYFFMPLRASTVTMRPSRSNGFRTPEQLSTVRGLCLKRDKHRCVISHAFDTKEALKRHTDGVIIDNDGETITDNNFAHSEVARIFPPSLVQVQSVSKELKSGADILNMFDSGVAHLINDVDRPRNALTLTASCHLALAHFDIFFTSVPDRPHTYDIAAFYPFIFQSTMPVRRALPVTQGLEPPSPRLLALHRAIARILHLSGAGAYIARILNEFEESIVMCDGSTPLAELVQLSAPQC